MHYIDQLKKMDACFPALHWCASRKFKSLSQAWESCERPDWMIWLLKRTGASDRDLRLLACAFARELLEFTGKYREIGENTISVAERYANGEATREELDAAYDAAYDATWDSVWKRQCDMIREMFKCPKLK